MSKINVLGSTVVLRKLPAWATEATKNKMGGYTVSRMPSTAFNPSAAQRKVQLKLVQIGKQMRGVSDIGTRNTMVREEMTGKSFGGKPKDQVLRERYAKSDANEQRLIKSLA